MLSLLKAILVLLLFSAFPRPAALPPDGIRSIQLPVGSGPPEIAVKDGIAHIVYSADGWGQVTYRRIDAFGEQTELIDSLVELNAALTSIAVSSLGVPIVVYAGVEPEGITESIYLAKRAGPGDWRVERIISGIDIREHFRIMYDDDDQEQIVFYSWQSDRWVVYHIWRDGWGWASRAVYVLPDNGWASIPAVDAAWSGGRLHIVVAVWNAETLEGRYLYFDGDSPPVEIRSAVAGSWIAYYRTMELKADDSGVLHLLSCWEVYTEPIPGEPLGFTDAIYSVYGFKPAGGSWSDIGFVHQDTIQSAPHAIISAGSELKVYQLADVGGSIALFSKSITGWVRTDNAVAGDWLDSADMALFGDSLLVVYSLREQPNNDTGD